MHVTRGKWSVLIAATLMALLMVIVTAQWWAAPAQAANEDNTPATATDLGNFTNTSSGQRTGQTLQHSATDAYN